MDLAEAISAGQERQEEPGLLPGRKDARAPDQEYGKKRIIEEVDDVIQPAPVEAGDDFLDSNKASEKAVGRIDDRCGRHQQERPAERVGAALHQ